MVEVNKKAVAGTTASNGQASALTWDNLPQAAGSVKGGSGNAPSGKIFSLEDIKRKQAKLSTPTADAASFDSSEFDTTDFDVKEHFAELDKDAISTIMHANLEPLFNALSLPKHGRRHECPFCKSKTAFSGEGGGIRCHACGWTGDGFSLVMEIRNLIFPEALAFAQDVYGYRPAPPPQRRKPKTKKKPRLQLDLGTDAEHIAVAKQRNVNLEAVKLAVERGLLRFATVDGKRCWIITDSTGRNMQARRVDGKPLRAGGREIKTKTIPGSMGAWPIGATEAQAFPCIALVEGSADVIAAHHFILCETVEKHIAVVGMMGGQNSIPNEALPLFAGKRIRIFPDADSTGRDAAARWYQQLSDAGAKVDCFSLEGLEGVNDLNDVTSIDPDTFEAERSLWGMFSGMDESEGKL